MNKQRKKDLIHNYKIKELEAEAKSLDPILSSFAKRKLGIVTEPLTSDRIYRLPESELVEVIIQKLEEAMQRTYKSNPRKYGSKENVLANYSAEFLYLYFTYLFEMQIELGDIDKFFESASIEKKSILSAAYRFFGYPNLASLIEQEDIETVENEFRLLQENIREVRFIYIRSNAEKFELE